MFSSSNLSGSLCGRLLIDVVILVAAVIRQMSGSVGTNWVVSGISSTWFMGYLLNLRLTYNYGSMVYVRSPIWEIEEINNLRPTFGGKSGWFYGLVRNDKNKIILSEIYPGLGYCKATPLYAPKEGIGLKEMPKGLWWIAKDIIWAARRSRK